MAKHVVLCFILFIGFSCQSDKNDGANQNGVDNSKKSVSAPVNAEEQHCFKINQENNQKELILFVTGNKMTGTFSVNEGKKYEGSIEGIFRGEDIITDFNYELDGKKHHEKMILSFNDQQAQVARSTSVMIDGERQPRNDGQATMDVISRVACD